MTMDWQGEEVLERVRRAAMRGVMRGAERVISEATSLILDTTKSGRIYQTRGVIHQASAPGEPPASDLGDLVGSAETRLNPTGLSAVVNWGVQHAEPLELGTERIEPRPFARPALTRVGEELDRIISEEIRAELG